MKHIKRKESDLRVIEIFKKDLSIAATKLYSDPDINRGLVISLFNHLYKDQFTDCAIYLYKRCLLELSASDLMNALCALEDHIRYPLFKGFRDQIMQGEKHKFTMYLIKNKYVNYV